MWKRTIIIASTWLDSQVILVSTKAQNNKINVPKAEHVHEPKVAERRFRSSLIWYSSFISASTVSSPENIISDNFPNTESDVLDVSDVTLEYSLSGISLPRILTSLNGRISIPSCNILAAPKRVSWATLINSFRDKFLLISENNR